MQEINVIIDPESISLWAYAGIEIVRVRVRNATGEFGTEPLLSPRKAMSLIMFLKYMIGIHDRDADAGIPHLIPRLSIPTSASGFKTT